MKNFYLITEYKEGRSPEEFNLELINILFINKFNIIDIKFIDIFIFLVNE